MVSARLGSRIATFDIVVPVAGLAKFSLSHDEVAAWINEEQEFRRWLVEALSRQSLIFNNVGYGNLQALPPQAVQTSEVYNALAAKKPDDIRIALENYLEPARQLKRVLVGTDVADTLREIAESQPPLLPLYVYIVSSDFELPGHRDSTLEILRFLYRGPSKRILADFAEAHNANAAADRALSLASEELERARAIRVHSEEETAKLEKLYHQKLSIEAPAKTWRKVQDNKRKERWAWFAAFVVLIAGATGGLVYNLEHIGAAIKTVSIEGSGAFTGLLLITVPTLGFAWLLRQVARLFSRAHDLEIDAAHREALAVTFLGLAKDEDAKLSERDRALILEALFRPQPPYLSEDGPPAGFVETLLKGR